MAKTLPPFEELVKQQQKPASGLPPFDQLKPKSKGASTAKPVNTDPRALAAAARPKKKKGQDKRERKAQIIWDFAKQYQQGHAMFFRHIRVPDPKNDGLPGPKGGATILVDMISDEEFRFSFAVCNLEEGDAYIKDEARKMCQDRFRNGQVCVVKGRDSSLSCFENIYEAIGSYLNGDMEEEPKLQVPLGMNDDSLSTLRRYIKKYGTQSFEIKDD